MSIKNKLFNVFLSAGLSFSAAVYSSQESMLLDLQNIHCTFNNRYAPKEWKELTYNWNAALQLELATAKITSETPITIHEFQRTIKEYLRSLNDYHVGCSLTSSDYAFLPFEVRSSEGRYFVSKFHKEIFKDKINIGDEVVSFNDIPLAEIGEKLRIQIERGSYDTDVALADKLMTERGVIHGLETPEGYVDIKFIDKKTLEPKTIQMGWYISPEHYTFHYEAPKRKTARTLSHPMFIAADWITRPHANEDDTHKRPSLPPLGKVVWKNDKDNAFQAYIFETEEEERVGFLRVGTFMPESIYYDSNCEDEMDELKAIVARFEKHTDKLVLDITNNGGGSLFYMYGVLSLFAKEPLELPKELVMMSPTLIGEFRYALEHLEEMDSEETAQEAFEDIVDVMEPSLQYVEELREFFKTIIAEWESGKAMSSSLHLYGFKEINPNSQAVYTKPILLLIDELDFSCADFFPAIMQDNKRAVIMGNRTAGAGGAVLKRKLYSESGIDSFTYTWTLGERSASGLPIENLGVTPDVEYKHTPEDLRNGFKEYKKAVLKQLQNM